MAKTKGITLKEEKPFTKLVVRLTPELETLLHTFTHRRGDVKNIFMATFETVIFKSVPLLERGVDRYGEGVFRKTTSVAEVPIKLYRKIEATAKSRQCSMNDLVTSALAWYLQEQRNKADETLK